MNAEIALDFAYVQSDTLEGGIDGCDRAAACFVKLQTVCGRADILGRSLEEPCIQMSLEIEKMFCNSGLRDAEISRRAGHGALLYCSDECLQGCVQIHL